MKQEVEPPIKMPFQELKLILKRQMGSIKGLNRTSGTEHVKERIFEGHYSWQQGMMVSKRSVEENGFILCSLASVPLSILAGPRYHRNFAHPCSCCEAGYVVLRIKRM